MRGSQSMLVEPTPKTKEEQLRERLVSSLELLQETAS